MVEKAHTELDEMLRHLMLIGFGALLGWTAATAYGVASASWDIDTNGALRFLLAILIVTFAHRTVDEIREWRMSTKRSDRRAVRVRGAGLGDAAVDGDHDGGRRNRRHRSATAPAVGWARRAAVRPRRCADAQPPRFRTQARGPRRRPVLQGVPQRPAAGGDREAHRPHDGRGQTGRPERGLGAEPLRGVALRRGRPAVHPDRGRAHLRAATRHPRQRRGARVGPRRATRGRLVRRPGAAEGRPGRGGLARGGRAEGRGGPGRAGTSPGPRRRHRPRRPARAGGDHDRTAAGVRRGAGRHGRLPAARADPAARRRGDDHGPRIHERHGAQRLRRSSRAPSATATGSRSARR